MATISVPGVRFSNPFQTESWRSGPPATSRTVSGNRRRRPSRKGLLPPIAHHQDNFRDAPGAIKPLPGMRHQRPSRQWQKQLVRLPSHPGALPAATIMAEVTPHNTTSPKEMHFPKSNSPDPITGAMLLLRPNSGRRGSAALPRCRRFLSCPPRWVLAPLRLANLPAGRYVLPQFEYMTLIKCL